MIIKKNDISSSGIIYSSIEKKVESDFYRTQSCFDVEASIYVSYIHSLDDNYTNMDIYYSHMTPFARSAYLADGYNIDQQQQPALYQSNNSVDLNIPPSAALQGRQPPYMTRAMMNRQVQRNTAMQVNNAQTMNPHILIACIVFATLELLGTIGIIIATLNIPETSNQQLWVGVYSSRNFVYLPQYLRRVLRIPETASELRLKAWVSLSVFCWIILGQSWFYSIDLNTYPSKLLYYWTMTLIICSYIIIFAPVLLLLGICFCLPCVQVFLRLITPNPVNTREALMQLPEKVYDPHHYKRGVPNEEVPEDAAGQGDNDDSSIYHDIETGKKRGDKTDVPKHIDMHHQHESEPSCSICMEDFKVGDSLRMLPCKHDFHKECVDKWLSFNPTCPLCRNSIFEVPVTASV